MATSLALVLPVLLLSALVAVVGADTRRPALLAVAKPLTTLLLFLVVGWPRARFAWWIDLGIAFSLIGDVALLGAGQRGFLIGLASFLVAHVAYSVAFVGAAAGARGAAAAFGSGPVAAATVILAVVTAMLLRKLWTGAAGLRGPLVIYALALAAMVVCAIAAVTAGGGGAPRAPVSPLAAVGAILFYVSDASLALNRFHRPIRHAPWLTLGVYWLGQLGIALAARLV